MNHRATGVVEILIILGAMAAGAVFVFFAFELGSAARPSEMRVWGSTENTSSSTSGSSSDSGSTSATGPSGTATPAALAGAGKAVFDKNCNGCHPSGNKGVGPALSATDFKQRYPQDSDVAKVIRGGKGAMPPFGAAAVSDNDLTALIGYIRSLSGGSTSASAQSSPTVEASSGGASLATGKAAFDLNCTVCHPGGKKGVGPAISGAEFREKFWLDKTFTDIVRAGRNGMPAFKSDRLSDDDLLSIVAYLRSLP